MMESLHWADWFIFVLFLLASLGIGVYHSLTGGRQRTTEEFIMANRELGVLPTMLSLLVSYQSAIMVLGLTAEMYTRGIQQWIMQIVFMSVAILIAERFIVPWMYELQLTSVYEYFSLRFKSRLLRVFAAFLGVLSGVLYMGVAMFAPAVALETATGFPKEASIPMMSILCVAYTSLGGMRAVIWTDVMQYIIMMGGILAILIKGSIVSGGFRRSMEVFQREDRLQWIDLDPDPTVRHTFWGFLFGWTSNWVFVYGFLQSSVQRYSGTGSLKDARLTVLLNIPAIIIMGSVATVSGIFVFTYYADVKRCDPLESGLISSPNEILPAFVKTVFADNTGFFGLFLATLYSGALSSVSSSLSGAAANTWEDIIKDSECIRGVSKTKAALINRVLVAVFGVLATGVAYMAAIVPGPITQVSLALVGAVGGPLCGMFLLGGLFKFTEWKGTLAGGMMGLLINLWISIGSITVKGQHPILSPAPTDQCVPPIFTNSTRLPPTFEGLQRVYTLSYLWYVPLSIVITITVGVIVSGIVIECVCKKGDSSSHNDVPDKLLLHWRTACTFATYDRTSESDLLVKKKAENMKRMSEIFHTNPTFTKESSDATFSINQTLNESIRSDGSYGPEAPPFIDLETSI